MRQVHSGVWRWYIYSNAATTTTVFLPAPVMAGNRRLQQSTFYCFWEIQKQLASSWSPKIHMHRVVKLSPEALTFCLKHTRCKVNHLNTGDNASDTFHKIKMRWIIFEVVLSVFF